MLIVAKNGNGDLNHFKYSQIFRSRSSLECILKVQTLYQPQEIPNEPPPRPITFPQQNDHRTSDELSHKNIGVEAPQVQKAPINLDTLNIQPPSTSAKSSTEENLQCHILGLCGLTTKKPTNKQPRELGDMTTQVQNNIDTIRTR